MKQTYKVKDRTELKEIISKAKDDENLNYLDVSNVIDMNGLFYNSKFNGDISNWNVSKVKHMRGMFEKSSFNGDISNWDISRALYTMQIGYNTWSDSINKTPKEIINNLYLNMDYKI